MRKLKAIWAKKGVKLTAAIVTIICLLVFIGGLNKPHLNPFTGTLVLKYPVGASCSGVGTVILDNQGQRLLILDAENKLRNITDFTGANSPIGKASCVTMYGDRIFVIGNEQFDKGAYFSAERVVEYDMRGKPVRTVYEKSYTKADRENRGTFAYLMAEADSIYLTTVANKEVTVLLLGEQAEPVARWTFPETVYTAGYSSAEKCGIAFGNSQTCYYFTEGNRIMPISFSEYLKDVVEYYTVSEASIDISAFEKCCCLPSIVINADGAAQYYSVVNPDAEQLLVITNDMSEQRDIGTIEYSAFMRFRTIGYWLAAAFLIGEAVVFAVWLLLAKKQSKGKTTLLIVAGILLISVFYSGKLQKASEESYINSLITQTKQFCFIVGRSYGDRLAAIGKGDISAYCTNAENQGFLDELHDMFKAMCDANDSAQSCYAACYLFDASRTMYTFADSCYSNLPGQKVVLSEGAREILGESKHVPLTIETYMETMVYDYDYIYDSAGNEVGVIAISGLRGNMRYVQRQNIVNTTVSLAAILIGVYMLFSVGKIFSADLKRRRMRDSADILGKCLDLAGIFSFMQMIIYSIDGVITVYVARSLCSGMDSTVQALFIALPMTAATFGASLGVTASTPFLKWTGERKGSVISATMTVVAMLLGVVSLSTGSIFIYIACKFIAGFFFGGIVYVIQQTLPYHAKEEETRKNVLSSVQRCSVAAVSVSSLMSGYISQYLSYRAIYLLGALLCVVFIVLCLFCFTREGGKNIHEEEPKTRFSGIKYWRMFLTGPGLMYVLFFLLPMVLVGGYKSYLFPMYTAGAGISALLLSKLSVFVYFSSFLLQGPVKRFAQKLNRNVALVAPMFLICACLMCFIISPNVYWAIATLLLADVLSRATIGANWLYIAELAESKGLDGKRAFGKYLSISNAIRCVQSPVVSQFTALGMNFACAAVGGLCGILFGIFAITEKMRKAKSVPAK